MISKWFKIFKHAFWLTINPKPIKVKKIEPDPNCTCKKRMGLAYGPYCNHCSKMAWDRVMESLDQVIESLDQVMVDFGTACDKVAKEKGLKDG